MSNTSTQITNRHPAPHFTEIPKSDYSLSMRTLFIMPLVLMSLVSFPSWGETIDDLVFYKGLYYKKISEDPFVVSDIPFTGEIMGNSNGSFINGEQEGLWVYYYGNGNLFKRGYYENGILHGFWEDFSENGTLLNVGNYVNGKWDGLWKRFYRNGQLQEKGLYIKDKKDGVWESFYEDGTVNKEKTGIYKNGVKVSD